MQEVDNFINLIREKGFVCPNPMVWNEFYNTFRKNNKMSTPLILAAWHHTSDIQKLNRLKEQLESISNSKSRDEAINFLNQIQESDWYKG
jgi:hypothetical protein